MSSTIPQVTVAAEIVDAFGEEIVAELACIGDDLAHDDSSSGNGWAQDGVVNVAKLRRLRDHLDAHFALLDRVLEHEGDRGLDVDADGLLVDLLDSAVRCRWDYLGDDPVDCAADEKITRFEELRAAVSAARGEEWVAIESSFVRAVAA